MQDVHVFASSLGIGGTNYNQMLPYFVMIVAIVFVHNAYQKSTKTFMYIMKIKHYYSFQHFPVEVFYVFETNHLVHRYASNLWLKIL